MLCRIPNFSFRSYRARFSHVASTSSGVSTGTCLDPNNSITSAKWVWSLNFVMSHTYSKKYWKFGLLATMQGYQDIFVICSLLCRFQFPEMSQWQNLTKEIIKTSGWRPQRIKEFIDKIPDDNFRCSPLSALFESTKHHPAILGLGSMHHLKAHAACFCKISLTCLLDDEETPLSSDLQSSHLPCIFRCFHQSLLYNLVFPACPLVLFILIAK